MCLVLLQHSGNPRHPQFVRTLSFSLGKKRLDRTNRNPYSISSPSALAVPVCWDGDLVVTAPPVPGLSRILSAQGTPRQGRAAPQTASSLSQSLDLGMRTQCSGASSKLDRHQLGSSLPPPSDFAAVGSRAEIHCQPYSSIGINNRTWVQRPKVWIGMFVACIRLYLHAQLSVVKSCGKNVVADDMVLFKIQICLDAVLEGMVVPGDQFCLVSCWLTVNP